MDFTEILNSVLSIVLVGVASVLARAAVVYVNTQIAKAEAAKPGFTDLLTEGARFAVKAAEQLGVSGVLVDKKKWALHAAQNWLDAAMTASGIKGKIDLALLDAAIEAAVWEEINSPKQLPAPPAGE